MLHQAANEGFRGVFIVAFDGPATGQGVVSVSLSDGEGALLNVSVCRRVLEAFAWDGLMRFDGLPSPQSFSASGIPPAAIVNQCYRRLLFAAFKEDLPERIEDIVATNDERALGGTSVQSTSVRFVIHALSAYDVARDAQVLKATNQKFARAANLVSQTEPVFEPTAFGRHGKVMDSWESGRHNSLGQCVALLRLADARDSAAKSAAAAAAASAADGAVASGSGSGDDSGAAAAAVPPPARGGLAPHVHCIEVSTQFHDGNHAHGVRIEASEGDVNEFGDVPANLTWHELLPSTRLDGHASHRFRAPHALDCRRFRLLRLVMLRDGGISRLRLYDSATLPASEAARFVDARPERFVAPIPPGGARDLDGAAAASAAADGAEQRRLVACAWRALVADAQATAHDFPAYVLCDVACDALGGAVLRCSNEHYGPGTAAVKANPPRGMFDGFETRRARDANHSEWAIVRTALPGVVLHEVVIDFSFFVHNNPMFVTVQYMDATKRQWLPLAERVFAKAYAGNTLCLPLRGAAAAQPLSGVRVLCEPCGGFNRVRLLSRVPFAAAQAMASGAWEPVPTAGAEDDGKVHIGHRLHRER